jgi:chromosome segregation ATPase
MADVASHRASIERDLAAAQGALAPQAGEDQLSLELPERQELSRRLSSLTDRVARATGRLSDPGELRAELGTLSFFARTLRQDARAWREALHSTLTELRKREAAARLQRRKLAAEHDQLLRHRDLLQAQIDHAASEMAQELGECRRTVPVIRLADTVTIASITVSRPRRRLRAGQLWLVTLAADRQRVLVREN